MIEPSFPASSIVAASAAGVLAVLTAGASIFSPALAQSPQIRLAKLEVEEKLKAGVGYDVALRFEMTGDADVMEVCFLWSGEGPYCWKSFRVDKAAGLIRTTARTNNPNKYTLTGFVRYRDGSKTADSNRVSAPIDVRR